MIFKTKKRLNIFDKIVLVLNALFAAALLLSYLAPVADPLRFSVIAILGFVYQVLVVLNILFIVYWLIRRRLYFLISTFCILIGITLLTANFRLHLSNLKNKGIAEIGTIRMMAYNVREFTGIGEYEDKPINKEIIQLVNSEQPDIINFEEFREKKSDSGATIKALEKTLKTDQYYFKSFVATSSNSSGNAIFTKFPIVDSGFIASPRRLGIEAIYVDLKLKNKIIRVYCIHLAAVEVDDDDKLKSLNGRLPLNRLPLILSKLDSAFIVRSRQVSIIEKHMSKCPYSYIVAGDFNDTPISFAVSKLSEGLKNTFVEKGNGLGTTYYSAFPKLHIDYILVSRQFDVINYITMDKKLSDHKPIISDLKLN